MPIKDYILVIEPEDSKILKFYKSLITIMSPNIALFLGTLKFYKLYFMIEIDNQINYSAKW